MNVIRTFCALAAPFGLAACLDLTPVVGSRPLNEDERDPKTDTGTAVTDGVADGPKISFANDIRPMIKRSASDPDSKGCYPCHDGKAAKHVGVDLGGLDLSTLGKLREGGGTSGKKIVIPGDPANSALVQKLKGTYPFGTRMPKSGPPFWGDGEIAIVEQWIAEGAQGDDSE
jgi:hypothetical protein